MKLLTEREQVRSVSAKWRSQYATYTSSDRADVAHKKDIGMRLAALNPEKATAADVSEIVGNESWVCPTECDECGESSWNVVVLGEAPDYDSSTACICVRCLKKAVALVSRGSK